MSETTTEYRTARGETRDEYATRRALEETADAFRQFSRNGRWGTCVACPRDRERHAYPEYCEHAQRYDHQLTAEELARTYRSYHDRARENFDAVRLRPGES